MMIRKATREDLQEMQQLFYDTITSINKKDYNEDQIAVWAAYWIDFLTWQSKLKAQHFFVAEEHNLILGFISIDQSGNLDYLYIHKKNARPLEALNTNHYFLSHAYM